VVPAIAVPGLGENVIPGLRIASRIARVPDLDGFDEAPVEVWRDRDGRLAAWAHTDGSDRWMYLPGVASYRIRPGNREVVAIPHSPGLTDLVVGGYWRTVLPMAVQLSGREVLHASAVVTAAGVVGFCAASMTGKSTLAYELSRRGYGLWSDDALAFDTTRTSIDALALPFQLQLREPYDDESHARTSAPASSGSEASIPLAAVCTLERARAADAPESAQVRRLAPAEAFRPLLSHAYCYSLDQIERNREMIGHYIDLAARIPIFNVVFRPRLEQLPSVLGTIERVVGMKPGRAP
jgi:hypothetical protein